MDDLSFVITSIKGNLTREFVPYNCTSKCNIEPDISCIWHYSAMSNVQYIFHAHCMHIVI